jgi:hypothetical protein
VGEATAVGEETIVIAFVSVTLEHPAEIAVTVSVAVPASISAALGVNVGDNVEPLAKVPPAAEDHDREE